MSDYELYYWPIPFRGQFVRAILAFAGKSWTEHDAATISKLKSGPLKSMPAPFVGPPVLIDNKTGFAVSQTAAIVLYLMDTLELTPPDPALRAMTIKVVSDANDVLDDVTLDGGRLMWTDKRWREYIPRLKHWMSIFEDVGRRHHLTAKSGFLLGGDAPGVADVVTATLWSTMTDRFPKIAALFEEAAPHTAALTRRVAKLPALAKLADKARQDYGEAYCGGQIEASLRKVLNA